MSDNDEDARIDELIEMLAGENTQGAKVELMVKIVKVKTAPPKLMAALKDLSMPSKIRAGVADVLGWVRTPEVFNLLLWALHDNDEYVRHGAAFGLGVMRNADATSPLIELLLAEEVQFVCYQICDSLAKLDAAGAAETALMDATNQNAAKREHYLGLLRDLHNLDRVQHPNRNLPWDKRPELDAGGLDLKNALRRMRRLPVTQGETARQPKMRRLAIGVG